MDVGENAQTVFRLHVGKHLQATVEAGATERMDGRAVGLVERRFEDDVYTIFLVQTHEFGGDCIEQLLRLDDTWSCYEYRFHLLCFVSLCLKNIKNGNALSI